MSVLSVWLFLVFSFCFVLLLLRKMVLKTLGSGMERNSEQLCPFHVGLLSWFPNGNLLCQFRLKNKEHIFMSFKGINAVTSAMTAWFLKVFDKNPKQMPYLVHTFPLPIPSVPGICF